MRRPPLRRPPVAVCALTGLVLAVSGCDTGGGTTSAPTTTQPATRAPTPTPTDGPMDDDTGTGPTTGAEDTPGGTPEDTSEGTQQVVTAGALLTNGDSGAVVRLAPGEEVVLRLTPPLQGGTPQVSDPEVLEVVPVQHFADPGYDEFELLAQSAGRARVEVRGTGADAVLLLLVEVQDR